jgi:hypothetical protein
MRYTRPVRVRLFPFLTSVAAALGCGDGIGRPIVESEPSLSASGSAGVAGAAGGFGGAGSGAYGGGLPAFGGRGWRDWEDEGREPPPDIRCEGIDEWPEDSAWMEQNVLGFLNYARDYGLPCGTGTEARVPRVVMKRELQCAARQHSRDMFENYFFGHVGSDGLDPDERMRRAGYTDFAVSGETIAESDWTGEEMVPYRALEALLAMGGSECAHLVDPRFDSVGIGFLGGLWTLDFAGP